MGSHRLPRSAQGVAEMSGMNLPRNIPINQTKALISDPVQAGLASGWQVTDASRLNADLTLETDVVIVGSGAGGGVTAEILALSGLRVLIVEEGALHSSNDFNMNEAQAYPQLYQESAARKTRDKAINILQGRTVGGSTTVNWTSSFRTPDSTLGYWQRKFGLHTYSTEALAPWFELMEQRLNISDWNVPPNENNDILRRGASKLGIPTSLIRRNVNGCWNLGYCGMGCPTNAKQSMLVTPIPSALARGATLLTHARAEQFNFKGDKVESLTCRALRADGLDVTGKTVTVRARHFVVAGGAINSPALLMRSGAPDPHGLLGKRTFLHPVVVSAATFAEPVNSFAGAPQTVYSDHFLHTQAIDGPMGYKLEVPPIHPVIIAASMPGFGPELADMLRKLPHTHVQLALLRDGFAAQAPGGTVRLRAEGSPEVDYPMNDFVIEGARRALLSMAELQFAAGALEVLPVHEQGQRYTTWAQAREAIRQLPLQALSTRVVS